MKPGPRTARLLTATGVVALALVVVAPLRQFGGWVPGLLAGIGVGCLLSGMYYRFAADACDSSTPAQRRRYLREFLPPMLAYVLVVIGSIWLLKRIDGPDWLRALIALAPVLPIGLALRAIARYVRAVDELQQRIELEAISIATALVSLGYLAGGFLQLAGIIDVGAGDAMIWVFPLVCFTYGIVKIVVSRRYQ